MGLTSHSNLPGVQQHPVIGPTVLVDEVIEFSQEKQTQSEAVLSAHSLNID